MRFSKLAAFPAALLFCLVASTCNAQIGELGPIETAKMYPPSILDRQQNELNLSAIKWQAEQNRTVLDRYQIGRDKMSEKIKALQNEIEKLNNELPGEIRMMDKTIRSQLIGKAMEELLMAKLELATRAQSVLQLEEKLKSKEKDPIGELKAAQHQNAIELARAKVDSASMSYERVKSLQANGHVGPGEASKSQLQLKIATSELRSVETEFVISQEQSKAKTAEGLSNARIDVAPIKARVAATEEFLKTLSEASSVMTQIEKRERAISLWEKDHEIYAKELTRASLTLDQLEILRLAIERQLKMDPRKQENPDDSKGKPFGR